MCGVNRYSSSGYCGCSSRAKAARAALHQWEEPCISGVAEPPVGRGNPTGGWGQPDGSGPNPDGGSGAVFFSGCTLRCRFCQNHRISSGNFGRELTTEDLARIFLDLQDQGAHNINLVTPTQYLPHITAALDIIRPKLMIPVVYNCGGYERRETIAALRDYVDIWLPDFKYFDNQLAVRFSGAKDYFETASAAIRQMIDQTGVPQFNRDNPSLMESGVIIRHMVLPGHRDDSIALLGWMKENLPEGGYLISLMSQYTPYHHDQDYPELNRRITSYEYYQVVDTALSLGLAHGFMQEKSSAKEEYTPSFHLEGL